MAGWKSAVKILFIENHGVFAANVVREFLSRHAVTVVPSIAAARTERVSTSFDVVLVDYDLDDGKGDEFVRELRAAGERIVVVGVSSHDEGNAALRRAGASAPCSKMHSDQIENVLAAIM
jgi:DNA-binding response OmpR family regulator